MLLWIKNLLRLINKMINNNKQIFNNNILKMIYSNQTKMNNLKIILNHNKINLIKS